MRRAIPWAGLGAVLVAFLCSCGVPLADQAQPVPGYASPTSTEAASPSTSADATEVLWFVEGDRLRRLVSPSSGAPSPAQAVALLAVSPQPPLRTLVVDPQGGTPLASVVDAGTPSPTGPTTVLVRLSDTFSRLAPADQVLMIGQVVLTVTEDSVAVVEFVDQNDTPVTVPLANGRLQAAPVHRSDYLTLAEPTPTPSATR